MKKFWCDICSIIINKIWNSKTELWPWEVFLDSSLCNYSKAPLENNTFAIETVFFLFKLLSNTDWNTPNLSQQIPSDTFTLEGAASQSV